MIRQPGAPRSMRRSSAIGLLNAEDDNAYGSNAQRYNDNKLKGSFVNRFKQNMEQRIEALQDTLEEIPTKAQQLSIRALKINTASTFVKPASEDNNNDITTKTTTHQGDGNWASMEDSNNSLEFGAAEDDAFDFENGFEQDDDGSVINPHLSEGSLNHSATPFVVTASSRNLGIKTRPEEGSKARAQSRDSCLSSDGSGTQPSNGNRLLTDLEDENIAKIKNGEDDSILQFSPEPKDIATVMDAVAATNTKNGTRNSFSASQAHQFDVPSHVGQDSKGGKRGSRTRTRRTDSVAEGTSTKSTRRSQRRSSRRPSADAVTLKGSTDGAAVENNEPRRRVRSSGAGRRTSKDINMNGLAESTGDADAVTSKGSSNGAAVENNEPRRRVRSSGAGRRTSKDIDMNGLAESTGNADAVTSKGSSDGAAVENNEPRRRVRSSGPGRRTSKDIDMNGLAESTGGAGAVTLKGSSDGAAVENNEPRRRVRSSGAGRRASKGTYMDGLAESTGDEDGPQRKTVSRTSSNPRRGSRKQKDELSKRAPKDHSLARSYHEPRNSTRRSSAGPGDRSLARSYHGPRTSARRSSAGPVELNPTQHIKLVF
jgi:hypothetical protein